MKTKCIILIVLGLILLAGISHAELIYTSSDELIFDEEPITGINEIPPVVKKDLEDFLYDIGYRESGGRDNVINTYGYLGKYQFSPGLLWRLGFRVTRDEFLSNPELQRDAMLTLLNHNEEVLKEVINFYDGKTFDELIVNESECYIETYTVTKSGILAAAHLIGPTRTRLFLEDRIVSRDGYGTAVTEYLYSFSGYNLNL